MKRISVDLSTVTNWETFHDLFAKTFEFPAYYGRNMDAWIDCFGEVAMSDRPLVLSLVGVGELKKRCPEIVDAINECSAFINYRHVEAGGEPVLVLSYHI